MNNEPQGQWPWKIEPYTEAEIEQLMKQPPLSETPPTIEVEPEEISETLPEGFTEFEEYETTLARIRRIMNEAEDY